MNIIDGASTTIGDALVMDDVTAAFGIRRVRARSSARSAARWRPTPRSIRSATSMRSTPRRPPASIRFILVSSIGAGDSRAGSPAGMLRVLGPVLVEKEKAERHLIDSGLTFTIMRPGVLKDNPATGKRHPHAGHVRPRHDQSRRTCQVDRGRNRRRTDLRQDLHGHRTNNNRGRDSNRPQRKLIRHPCGQRPY